MPTYEITAPNGKKYRIEGPAGATDAQVRAAVLSQHPDAEGGDDLSPAEARKALEAGKKRLDENLRGKPADEAERARKKFDANPRIRSLTERAGEERGFLNDLGRSTVNTAARAAQGAIAPFTMLEEAASKVNQTVSTGLGKVGGGILRAAGLEGAGDRFESAAQENAARQAATPTVHGLIEQAVPRLPGIASTASEITGAMMVPLPKFAQQGTIRAPVVTAGKPVAASIGREVIEEGQRAGVRVMTSDVRPPKTAIGKLTRAVGERIPFVGTGGPRAAQQAERVAAVRNLLLEYGGDDAVKLFDDVPSAVDDVAKSLVTKRSADLGRYTAAKTAVIEKFDDAVPVPRAVSAIDEQIAKLQATGLDEMQPVIAKMEGWKRALQGKDLRNIEEIRRVMGEAFSDPGLAAVKSTGQKALNKIYGPLREDMGEFILKTGGKADFAKWKNANARLAEMAGELDSTTFKNVLKNADMTPEAVGRLLFSKNKSDVTRLVANLDDAGRSRAQAAVIQRAFDKAVSPAEGLSVERFVNNIDGLGSSVGVVFKGDDLVRIKGFQRLLDSTRRAAEAAALPATGVQNMPVVGGYALGSLFGKAAIPVAAVGGALARAYESAPVRNVLLALGKAKVGSVHEARLLTRAQKLIAATVVTQGNKLSRAANENVGIGLAAGEREENQGEQ